MKCAVWITLLSLWALEPADAADTFTQLGHSEVLLVKEKMTFEEAGAHCENIGSNLIEFWSEEEWKEFTRWMVSHPSIWIGLTDKQTEGTFKWKSGRKLSLNHWSPGEPNGQGNENCVDVFGEAPFMSMNDLGCDERREFVCQKRTSAEPFDGFNARYSDCTNVFKNRVVHLEYMYYPSKWVYPRRYLDVYIMGLYWATPDDAKSYESSGTSKAKWVAHPHPDGQGLALESMAPGWQHYYGVQETGNGVINSIEESLEYKSHIGDLSDEDSESSWRIHCTNECRPKNGEEDLFNECVLSQAGSFHYHEHRGLSRFTTDKHPEDWFRYRIYAPQTETHWEEVHQVDNCNPNNDPLPATYTAKSSVTITTKSSQKVSVGQTSNFGGTFKTALNAAQKAANEAVKVEAGRAAAAAAAAGRRKRQLSFDFQLSNTVTHEWTREDIRAETEERTRTIGSAGAKTKMIQPGKKWKVFQIAGKVGYWNIKSLSIKSCDCDCNEECSPQADNSCSPMTI